MTGRPEGWDSDVCSHCGKTRGEVEKVEGYHGVCTEAMDFDHHWVRASHAQAYAVEALKLFAKQD